MGSFSQNPTLVYDQKKSDNSGRKVKVEVKAGILEMWERKNGALSFSLCVREGILIILGHHNDSDGNRVNAYTNAKSYAVALTCSFPQENRSHTNFIAKFWTYSINLRSLSFIQYKNHTLQAISSGILGTEMRFFQMELNSISSFSYYWKGGSPNSALCSISENFDHFWSHF